MDRTRGFSKRSPNWAGDGFQSHEESIEALKLQLACFGEKHYAVDSNDIALELFCSRPSKTAESWAAWSSSRSSARLQNRHEPIDGRGNFVTAPCHLHHAEDLFRE